VFYNKEKKIINLLINNKYLEGAFFIYDFKEEKIVMVNDALARLFGYEDKDDLNHVTHDKLVNLVGGKIADRLKENFKRGLSYFNLYFSYFTKDNHKRYAALIGNIIKNTNIMYSLIVDVTEQIEFKNKIENNFLQDITQKNLMIRSLLQNYEIAVRIDCDTFKAITYSVDGEEVKESDVNVDWNDYYRFVLNLMIQNDADRLASFATKEALVKMLEDNQIVKTETFQSAFKIRSAAKNDSQITYELIVEMVKLNDKNYAFLLIRTKNQKDSLNTGFNILSALATDYSSIFMIDEEKNTISINSTTDRFKVFFKDTDELDFDYAMNIYADKFVYEDDKEFFKQAVEKGALYAELKDRPSYILKFRRVFDGVVDLAMFYFIKTQDSNNKNKIILAVRTASNDDSAIYTSEIERDTLTDVLTYNGFVKCVNKKIKENNYEGYVIRFDIDHFTKYNNLFGVAAGDKILSKIGNILNALSKKYDTINGRFAGDTFLVYLNSDLNTLDHYINKLKERLQNMSNIFDFVITTGVYKANSKSSARDMIEGAALAADKIKKNYDKTYEIYNDDLRIQVVERTNRLNSLVQALKENKLESYFKPVFRNDSIMMYDYNIMLQNNTLLNEKNLYLFLEANGLALAVNRRCVNEVLDIAKNNKKKYVLYLTNYFFVKEGEVDNIINKIDEYQIDHSRICISVEPSILDKGYTVYNTIKKLRNINIDVMFDFSNNTSMDFRRMYECGINCIKIDLNNFLAGPNNAKYILYNIVEMMTSAGYIVYIAHASDEIISRIKQKKCIVYSKDDNTLYKCNEFVEK